jgi:dTDP-4-amino-4,6-dideoxygalactose transaminase
MAKIPFNLPPIAPREREYVDRVLRTRRLGAGGEFTRACEVWLEQAIGVHRAVLVHSCTAGLEMAAILAETGPGDEVIMPSFTFPSTATAFVLRGATPVFVDIREDTLNIDEAAIEPAITDRTKAVVPVHYAGVGCDMNSIMELANSRHLTVIEDAAQALCASRNGRSLGSYAQLAALSFHESKNITSGEGGALLINDPSYIERAEIIRDKGTNRRKFFAGEVDKYTWVDLGSSYAPSELVSALLLAQLEEAVAITARRYAAWSRYHEMLADLELAESLRRPVIPAAAEHNGHIYYVLLPSRELRDRVLARFAELEIGATFHYVPLHTAHAGRRYGRMAGPLHKTEELSSRLIRLPLYADITPDQQMRVVNVLASICESQPVP